MIEPELSRIVLDAFFAVYRTLGYGFLEAAYANAFCVELQKHAVHVRRQVPIEVVGEGVVVGTYRCDIVVEGRILVELKASRSLCRADERQVLNYLRATRIELGFLLHFGPEARFRRWVLTNDRKG